MPGKKDKARRKLLRKIYELFDELVYLNYEEKWFVDHTIDELREMGNPACAKLIVNLNKRISDRSKK